ncbi:MAG TPA: hypothetical protein VEK15_04700 [Vicinamibacteria bacterium]|nr:hypothetical protein [Vicinamibacteria bacterium]
MQDALIPGILTELLKQRDHLLTVDSTNRFGEQSHQPAIGALGERDPGAQPLTPSFALRRANQTRAQPSDESFEVSGFPEQNSPASGCQLVVPASRIVAAAALTFADKAHRDETTDDGVQIPGQGTDSVLAIPLDPLNQGIAMGWLVGKGQKNV